MEAEWIIARTFIDPDGVSITRYWSGGRNWHDTARQANARFKSPQEAVDRYEATLRSHGRRWQGEISTVEVVPRNICPPTGKMKHPSREHAERFLLQIWQDDSFRAKISRRERRVYECPHQQGEQTHWHLTSKEDWNDVDPTRSSRVG